MVSLLYLVYKVNKWGTCFPKKTLHPIGFREFSENKKRRTQSAAQQVHFHSELFPVQDPVEQLIVYRKSSQSVRHNVAHQRN